MNKEEYINKVSIDISNIINSILHNEIDFLIGLRTIVVKFRELPFKDDPDYRFLRGLDSETDCFPTGDQRKMYGEEYLKKMDIERDDFLIPLKKEIDQTLKNLLQKIS